MMRDLIYIEDHQMYERYHIWFRTDCNWSIDEMKELSWSPPEAGRISTSFKRFSTLLKTNGFIVRFKDAWKEEEVSDYSNDIEGVIKGATGNY